MKSTSLITKNVILLFVVCMACQSSFAQSKWFADGATWHYDCGGYIWGTPWHPTGYYTLYHDGDTMINNLSFTILRGELDTVWEKWGSKHYSQSKYYFFDNDFYVREDSNIVYWHRLDFDSTYVLYDFTSEPGDTWYIPPTISGQFGGSSIYPGAYVDSIGYIELNGDTLKRYFLSYDSYQSVISLGPVVTERIGARDFFFPVNRNIQTDFTCYFIRCYQDDYFPLVNYFDKPCDYTVSTEESSLDRYIKISPNPVRDVLHIDYSGLSGSPEPDIQQVTLYSPDGALVRDLDVLNGTIDFSQLGSGLYILQIRIENQVYNKKVVKM